MDLDFTIINNDERYEISILEGQRRMFGNPALVNRFHIAFLKDAKVIVGNSTFDADYFGGSGGKFISNNLVKSNPDAIIGAINIVVTNTVNSLKATETDDMPDTEKLDSAIVTGVTVTNANVVEANIEIIPVEIESSEELSLRVPIIKKDWK